MASGRFKELLKKYGKVAIGVHLSVSAASLTGLYVAIKSNVDVQSLFDKYGLSKSGPLITSNKEEEGEITNYSDEMIGDPAAKKRNRTAEMAASTGGAIALAILCNKALIPVRIPITIVLTPPIARYLARRQLIKNAL